MVFKSDLQPETRQTEKKERMKGRNEKGKKAGVRRNIKEFYQNY